MLKGLKTKITALAIMSLMSGAASADLSTGLMAYYNFDDCSANDTSGNANNGTINGNLSCITGVVDKALQFDGASYINVPNAASLNPVDQLAVSFWVRVDAFNSDVSTIIHKGGTNPNCFENREYAFHTNIDSTFHQTSSGDGNCANQMDSKKVIAIGKWLHYVGIIDRKRHVMSIYINGALNAKQVDSYNTLTNNNHDLRIGLSEEGYYWESPFKGALDEIRLYNRALTAAEITALYNEGVSVKGTVKSVAAHTVTCLNNPTAQSITIPATKAAAYDCEAKGLEVKPQDHITITIDGNAQ